MLTIALLGFLVIGCGPEEEPIEDEEVIEEQELDEGAAGEDNGFEEAKPQLEEQLRQEKEQELLMEHIEDLKEKSNVEKYPEKIGEGEDDAVVARVDQQEIYLGQFRQEEEQQMQMMMQQGMDPESPEAEEMMEEMRPQILDNLINNLILENRVEEEGITISEEEIDEEFKRFAEQSGGEEALEQQMEEAGITEEELKEDIALQMKVETYMENFIEENINEEKLEFSEEELRELYDELQEQQQQMDMEIEEEN